MGILALMKPVIDILPNNDLGATMRHALLTERDAIEAIEGFFSLLPLARWSPTMLRTVLGSWKATHLKMLAIYGLSCRIQRLAASGDNAAKVGLYSAAACNASSSYEDLGLDYNGYTHSALYDDFAFGLSGDDQWQLPFYRNAESHDFGQWVYRNMVVEEIPVGLLTNMFSELYNHAEYHLALEAFDSYLVNMTTIPRSRHEALLTYIRAHVDDDTEAGHFLIVAQALTDYLATVGEHVNLSTAETLFRTYLRRLGAVMRALIDDMREEFHGGGDDNREVVRGMPINPGTQGVMMDAAKDWVQP